MQRGAAGVCELSCEHNETERHSTASTAEVDRVWFHAAVERHRNTVFRVAFNYLCNAADADDVCQDVFVALYRSNRSFESDEHLKAWLIRVTINRCKSMFRMPWRKVENIDDYAERLSLSPTGHEVLQAVMNLPKQYRLPIYLFYYEGYHTAEIAQMLDVPDATVRTRLARARKRLAPILREDGSHD